MECGGRGLAGGIKEGNSSASCKEREKVEDNKRITLPQTAYKIYGSSGGEVEGRSGR